MKNKDDNEQLPKPFDADCSDDIRDGFGPYDHHYYPPGNLKSHETNKIHADYMDASSGFNCEGKDEGYGFYGLDGQPGELTRAEYSETQPKLIELNKG